MYEDEPTAAYDESSITKASHLPLSGQEKAIAELHDMIGQLTLRLKPVLTPLVETDKPSTVDKDAPLVSPLAEQLHSNNEGIYKASSKLRALMDRLEC